MTPLRHARPPRNRVAAKSPARAIPTLAPNRRDGRRVPPELARSALMVYRPAADASPALRADLRPEPHNGALPARAGSGRVSPRPFLLVAGLFLAAWVVLVATRGNGFDPLNDDQSGYWAYLPSLVLDGDLDFANQRMPWVDDDATNRWPIGVALTAAPAFAAAHAVCLGLDALGLAGRWAAPDGYSAPYLFAVFTWLLAVGAAAAWLGARLLVERYDVPPRPAVLAVLAWWLGSNVTWHYFRVPVLAHAPGAAWALAAVYAGHRLLPRRASGQATSLVAWSAAFAFACSMLVVTRYASALIAGPLAVAVVGGLLWRGRWRGVLRALPLALLACWPLAGQYGVWRATHASPPARPAVAASVAPAQSAAVPVAPRAVGYGVNEVFFWTRPALLRVLFSSRHGLVFFSPVLLFAAWGLWVGLRRRSLGRDALLVALLVAFAGVWYVNAAWYSWWFGASFGQRAMIELAPLYVIGLGVAFAGFARLSPGRRRAAATLVLAAIAVNWLLMALWAGRLISHDDYLIQWEERHGRGVWQRI